MKVVEIVSVYVLANEINDDHYVGISADVAKRLQQHNSGTSRYTKAYMPWRIIYTEEHPDYKEARVREKYLKSAAGRRFLKKILASEL